MITCQSISYIHSRDHLSINQLIHSHDHLSNNQLIHSHDHLSINQLFTAMITCHSITVNTYRFGHLTINE